MNKVSTFTCECACTHIHLFVSSLSLFSSQVIIFVKSVQRAKTLSKLLVECNFPALCIHGGLNEKERRERFQAFKDFESRILITTNSTSTSERAEREREREA